MFIALKQLLGKLASRPDTEHVQSYLRILVGFLAMGYALLVDRYANQTGGWPLNAQLLAFAAGIGIGGIGFLVWMLVYPATNQWRRWLGIIHDNTWNGVVLHAFGDAGAWMFSMYIWLVIGNGFRFGVRYLYGSAALALLSFYLVAYFTPYYRSNFGLLGLGTFLLAVVIPIYLGSLLKKLQRSLQDARKADRLKTRFLSNVSHDLRTPLNVIMANCDLLGHELGGENRKFRQVQDMQEAATTLNGLLVDLLDVAKIEAGRIKLHTSAFNPVKLLGRITRFNRLAALENGTQLYLTIMHNMPARFHGDVLRLEQILNNLVSNAVKCTEHGDVHIYARPAIDHSTGTCSGIICSIRDTGIGMAPEAVDRIFSRFEQADVSYAQRYSGAGLGLSIASELVNLMGGSIEVESSEGEGSCFTLTVPLTIDTGLDIELVPASSRIPAVVICGNQSRQDYWERLLGGTKALRAQVLTLQGILGKEQAATNACCNSVYALVDARYLGVAIEDLPALTADFFGRTNVVWILVNAAAVKRISTDNVFRYRAYRCWLSGTLNNDLNKALAIAHWSTFSERTETDGDEELQTWIARLKGLTVLVADDNELNRRVIGNMLGYIDARIIEARDGAEALEKLSGDAVDIALLDIQMPALTGTEVMHAYAARKPDRPVPFIVLTADTTEECRSRCVDAGAASILFKPVIMKSLYRELHRIVSDSAPQQAARIPKDTAATVAQALLDYRLLRELSLSSQHPEYMATLVSCFKRDGEQLLQELRHALKINDSAGSRVLLHRLKGMSGTIGASAMAKLCHDSQSLSDEHLATSAHFITERLFSLHGEIGEKLDSFVRASHWAER